MGINNFIMSKKRTFEQYYSLNDNDHKIDSYKTEISRRLYDVLTYDDNVLIPTFNQYKRFIINIYNPIINNGFISLSKNSDWYKLWWINEPELPVLFSYLNNGTEMFYDQLYRASKIIDKMLEDGTRYLITLDGHGRFVLCFFHMLKMKGEDMDEWTIELIDNNKNVNSWHKVFFPDTIFYVEGNYEDIILNPLYPHLGLWMRKKS